MSSPSVLHAITQDHVRGREALGSNRFWERLHLELAVRLERRLQKAAGLGLWQASTAS